MTRVLGVLLGLLLMASCGTPTIAPALPTSLVVPEDLPAPLSPLSTPMVWSQYPGMPRTDSVAYYEVIRGGDRRDEVGHITIAYYSGGGQERAYGAVMDELSVLGSVQPVEGLGEQGQGREPTSDWPMSEIAFVRCNAVVHVALPTEFDEATGVAQRIYDRLEPVCASSPGSQ